MTGGWEGGRQGLKGLCMPQIAKTEYTMALLGFVWWASGLIEHF